MMTREQAITDEQACMIGRECGKALAKELINWAKWSNPQGSHAHALGYWIGYFAKELGTNIKMSFPFVSTT